MSANRIWIYRYLKGQVLTMYTIVFYLFAFQLTQTLFLLPFPSHHPPQKTKWLQNTFGCFDLVHLENGHQNQKWSGNEVSENVEPGRNLIDIGWYNLKSESGYAVWCLWGDFKHQNWNRKTMPKPAWLRRIKRTNIIVPFHVVFVGIYPILSGSFHVVRYFTSPSNNWLLLCYLQTFNYA